MILDTVQQIPTGSILSCIEGISNNRIHRTSPPGIPITPPIESRQPPIPFREYKVKSVRKGRGWYKVRAETLGEMGFVYKTVFYPNEGADEWGGWVEDYILSTDIPDRSDLLTPNPLHRGVPDKPIGTPLNPLDW